MVSNRLLIVVSALCIGWIGVASMGPSAPGASAASLSSDFGGRPHPRGINYYRMGKIPEDGNKVEHVELLPDFYDPAQMDEQLGDIADSGFNTVRVFLSYAHGEGGVVKDANARRLSPAYVSDVIDFLRRARSHGLQVIFTSDWTPESKWLQAEPLSSEGESHLLQQPVGPSSPNNKHLFVGFARARANLIIELIKAIKAADPTLLRAVFAWELENESAFILDKPPFDRNEGEFDFDGRSYDLSSDAQKQDLMDAVAIAWANLCADAVHAADPGALVSDSVFSFDAVHRSGPAAMSTDKSRDPRAPFRLLALAQSRLDYIDAHLYVSVRPRRSVAENVRAELKSIEWDALKPELERRRMPIIAGEVGVFKRDFAQADGSLDVARAASALGEHVDALARENFQGVLYWSYGNPESRAEDDFPPLQIFPQLGESLAAFPAR